MTKVNNIDMKALITPVSINSVCKYITQCCTKHHME